ncbi:MAG TPA: site-2 protease family protein [Frankiaceae bacterium]|nr:site-2 protease family protein [Frankiaceae bacterium]
MSAIGIVAFVLALLISVVLHEAGHFAFAKKFGMKATQFFVGFGPTIWSRQKGETEYGLKAIPAGGYVKIIGMTDLEPVDPADEPRAFYRQPAGKRAIVLSAGSFTHFLIAIVLLWLSLWLGGQPNQHRVEVATVQQCVSADVSAPCGSAISPARSLGLLPGDEVVALNGAPVTGIDQFRTALSSTGGRPLTIAWLHGGVRHEATTTLQAVDVGGQQVWRIGVGPQNPTESVGPLAAIGRTPGLLGQLVTNTADSLAHFPDKLKTIFSPNRDPAGAVGVIGISRVSGDILSLPDESLSVRIATFLLIVAGVNFFVGVFNLLPLLPLDGGHLAVLGYEQGRHRLRRARGYRGPVKRVDLNKLLPATYAVVAIFMVLTLVLATADIVNPINLR